MRLIALVLGLILAMQVSPAAAADDPFVVHFTWDSDALSPHAQEELRVVAERYKAWGGVSVVIAGHTDRSSPDSYNVGLSQRRANAVRSYLASIGIPDSVMSTEAFGEYRPVVETANGMREPANERVEITFGPG